jgi:hypothetical protein
MRGAGRNCVAVMRAKMGAVLFYHEDSKTRSEREAEYRVLSTEYGVDE